MRFRRRICEAAEDALRHIVLLLARRDLCLEEADVLRGHAVVHRCPQPFVELARLGDTVAAFHDLRGVQQRARRRRLHGKRALQERVRVASFAEVQQQQRELRRNFRPGVVELTPAGHRVLRILETHRVVAALCVLQGDAGVARREIACPGAATWRALSWSPRSRCSRPTL